MKRFLPFFMLIFANICSSQAPHLIYRNYYPDVTRRALQAVGAVQDAKGNIYVTGIFKTSGAAQEDIVTVSFDANGQRRWAVWYDGGGVDLARAITIDNQDAIYITGSSFGDTDEDLIVLKYGKDGNALWPPLRYDEVERMDAGIDIVTNETGDVFITGASENEDGQTDIITLKYSADRTLQWRQIYDRPNVGLNDAPVAIGADAEGSVYIAGISERPTVGWLAIKYDSAGQLIWADTSFVEGAPSALTVSPKGDILITGVAGGQMTTRGYRGDPNALFLNHTFKNRENNPAGAGQDVAADADGNIFVAGWQNGDGGDDFTLVKYEDDSGDKQGHASYANPGKLYDRALKIVLAPNGEPIIGGVVDASDAALTDGDFGIVRFGADGGNGELLTSYNGPGNGTDILAALMLAANGDILAAGTSAGGETGDDFVAIKTSPSGEKRWISRFNGERGLFSSAAMVVDFDRNVYITGTDFSDDSTGDIFTMRYNANGDSLLWQRRYDGPAKNSDVAFALGVDQTGNVYVAGSSIGNNSGKDFTILKYDAAQGDSVAWVKRINTLGANDDAAEAMYVDARGNVYAAGWTENDGGSRDLLTVKYNTNGHLQWNETYDGGAGNDEAADIAVDSEGNTYVSASSLNASRSSDYLTLKYSPSGVLEWTKRYNGAADGVDIPSDIEIDSTGNIYVTGQSFGADGTRDIVTVKYTSSGDSCWTARYQNKENSGEEAGAALAVDRQGNVFVTGYQTGAGTRRDMVIIKYDASGKEIAAIGRDDQENSGDDEAVDIALDSEGNVYITGKTMTELERYNMLTMKYDNVLTELWAFQRDYNNNDDFSQTVYVDQHNDVYVGGFSISASPSSEAWGVSIVDKYFQDSPVSVANDDDIIAVRFSLRQNYPNPFNPETTIEYALPKQTHAKLVIYDLTGRLVAALVDEIQAPGVHRLIWNGKNVRGQALASGVYFYSLATSDFKETRKLVLVR